MDPPIAKQRRTRAADGSVVGSSVASRTTPPLYEGGETVMGKRVRTVPGRFAEGTEDGDLTAHLRRVLLKLKEDPASRWFLTPVTEQDAPNYFEIIKEPMD